MVPEWAFLATQSQQSLYVYPLPIGLDSLSVTVEEDTITGYRIGL